MEGRSVDQDGPGSMAGRQIRSAVSRAIGAGGNGGYLESVRRDGAINWPKVTFLRVSSLENDWTAWIEGAGAQIEIAEDLHFDTVALATEAAATGMGIAIGRAPLISPDLAAGRLVMADTKVIDIETGYWLVGPDGQETRPAIRSFRRWVIEEAKEYCAQNGLR